MLNISLLRICSPRPPSRTGSDKSMNLVAIPPYQIMIMDHSSEQLKDALSNQESVQKGDSQIH